jgi:sugar O-acyltransferase (sialic acid O-acetyltransferase NeuD family)
MNGTVRTRVAIAGAGGMGREVLAWLRDADPTVEPVVFFAADSSERPQGAGVDLAVRDSLQDLSDLGVEAAVLGIGDWVRRRGVADELRAAGFALLSVVHPTAFVGPGVTIAEAAIVAPGCVLTRDITVGRGAIVNYRAAVGHDCHVGAFAFLGPGAVLTGDVHIGEGVLVGAGAVILPRRSVGDGATIGAGAVVTRDVADGVLVIGNPARVAPGPGGSDA